MTSQVSAVTAPSVTASSDVRFSALAAVERAVLVVVRRRDAAQPSLGARGESELGGITQLLSRRCWPCRAGLIPRHPEAALDGQRTWFLAKASDTVGPLHLDAPSWSTVTASGRSQADIVAEGLVQHHRDAPHAAGYRVDPASWRTSVLLPWPCSAGRWSPSPVRSTLEDIAIERVGNRHAGGRSKEDSVTISPKGTPNVSLSTIAGPQGCVLDGAMGLAWDCYSESRRDGDIIRRSGRLGCARRVHQWLKDTEMGRPIAWLQEPCQFRCPDRRCGVGRGGRGFDFAFPTLVKGFIRPVGPLLSLQVGGCYLQLDTGSGTEGVYGAEKTSGWGLWMQPGSLDGVRRGGVGRTVSLGSDAEGYQW